MDASRPDVHVNEQLLALKLASKRLEAAYRGEKVEWPKREREYSQRGERLTVPSHGLNEPACLPRTTPLLPTGYISSTSSDSAGSGDGCDGDSDDEDCYYHEDYSDYYEGSGSGEDDDDYYYTDGEERGQEEVIKTNLCWCFWRWSCCYFGFAIDTNHFSASTECAPLVAPASRRTTAPVMTTTA